MFVRMFRSGFRNYIKAYQIIVFDYKPYKTKI